MQIVIVRHGQSTNNARHAEALLSGPGAPETREVQIAAEVRDYPGRVADPALSAQGVRQAESLGRALADGRTPFAPTHLYASATTRAVQTARPLAEATGLPVVLHADAYEVGGIYLFDPRTCTRQPRPGATLRELREHCPSLEPTPGLFDAPDQRWSGGLETEDEQALPRAVRFLTELGRAHGPDDVVMVVGHQYFCQFVMAAALGWATPPWRRFRLDNTGHLSLRLDGGCATIDWVNRVDHLDPSEVTN